ncbi:MAG: dihydroorotase, partial [Chromatiales bacterium]
IELYAEAFEAAGALDRLEAFASHFGPDFYGLPRNTDTITLVNENHRVPAGHPGGITPLRADEDLTWRLT